MGPARRRSRRRGLVAGAVVGSAMAKNSASNAQPSEPVAQVPAQSDMATQLQELAKLKDQGILTQEEFDAKKAQLLGL